MASKALHKRIVKIKEYRVIYLFVIPIVIYLCIFRYYPIITQFVLSLNDYGIQGGCWNSPWIGLGNYITLFSSRNFGRILFNTFRISVLQITAGFIPPIILAIALFDMTSNRMRRVSQSILYIPHFFSWVVIYNIVHALFANEGYINGLLNALGIASYDFLIEKSSFLPMLIGSSIWKELGWGTIIYLAALTSIDTELFDVAKIDGAGPLQRIWYITLPGILSVVVFCLAMSLGRLLSAANTEQILLFQGPQNLSVSDVLGTWEYRQGLGKMQYSLGASISMFQSVIGLSLVLTTNKLATKLAGVGIW